MLELPLPALLVDAARTAPGIVAPRQPLRGKFPLVLRDRILDRANLAVEKQLHATMRGVRDRRNNRPFLNVVLLRQSQHVAPFFDLSGIRQGICGQKRSDHVKRYRNYLASGFEKRLRSEPRSFQLYCFFRIRRRRSLTAGLLLCVYAGTACFRT